MPASIDKSNLTFLRAIAKNNNREWFAENKAKYTDALENTKAFVEAVKLGLEKTDEIEKAKLFRIYKDVRFSKDKTPYKSHWSCSFTRAGARLRGGYYLQIKPGGDSMVGGGFYNPNPKDLKRIREEFKQDEGKAITKIVNRKKFQETFGDMLGDKVKTSPRGYSEDDPAIDWLRHKSFYVMKKYKDSDVTDPNFAKEVVATFKVIRPWFDYMSEVLTTDVNGVSLV